MGLIRNITIIHWNRLESRKEYLKAGKFDTRTGAVDSWTGAQRALLRDLRCIILTMNKVVGYIMLPQSLESNKMDIRYLLCC